MKKMRMILRTLMIAFAMLFAMGAVGLAGAPGADKDGASLGVEAAYAADDDDYTYTVSIYSGKEGYFGSKDKHEIRVTGLKYGQEYTLDLNNYDLKLLDSDKYYVRGVKLSGHDNDELSRLTFQSYTFKVTKDQSFSVAYGMKGGMVKYTVSYIDEDGNELLPSKDYYGMAGDKPVVSCKYVEGYLPDNENLTATLSTDENENAFTFTYHQVGAAGENGEEGEGNDNDNGNANGNANANANGAANANAAADGNATANIGDNATPAAGVTDLDDNETPMAPGNDSEKNGLLSGMTGLMGGIVGAGILIALLLLYLVLRKKKGEEE